MINGISNSFSATIDGLTNFELSSLTVDELESTNVTVSNNLTVSAGGTLTLPNASILDPYLSANVALKDAANTFTQTNTFPTIVFDDSTSNKIYWKPDLSYRTYIGGTYGASLVTETSFEQGISWKFAEDAFETVGIGGTDFFVNNVDSTFEKTVSIGYTTEQHTTDIPGLRFNHQYNGGIVLLRYLTDPDVVGGRGNGVFYFDVRRNLDADDNYRDGLLTFRATPAGSSSLTNREVASIDYTGFITRKGKRVWFKNDDDVLSGSILANGFEQVEYDSNTGHRFKITGNEVFNFDGFYSHFLVNLEMDIGKQISFQNDAATVCGQIYADSSEHIIHNANVAHIFQTATTDVMTINSSSVNVVNGYYLGLYESGNTAYATIKTELQTFIITTLIYDAESHSFKIDGTEIFRIDKDPSFGTITNQFKREVNIRSGYKLVLYAPDDTAFSTVQTATDGSLRLVGATVIWRALDASGNTVSVLTATGDDVTVKASNGLKITNSTGAYTSYMNQNGIDFNIYQANDGFTNFKGVNLAGLSQNVIQFTYSTLTFGVDMTCMDINQSTTKIINQTGTGTNQLKGVKITGNLEVTGTVTITGANIAYLGNTQTFTGTNTFDEQMTMKKSLNLPTTYVAKTGAQLGYSGTAPVILSGTITMSSGSTYNVAEIVLNIGEWMIYGVASYSCNTVATTLTSVEYSISATSGALDGDCLLREYTPANVTGQPIVPLSTFVSVSTSSTTYYLVVRVVFTGGSFVRNSTSAANCRIKAVRIA
jgi:hypothetical protein